MKDLLPLWQMDTYVTRSWSLTRLNGASWPIMQPRPSVSYPHGKDIVLARGDAEQEEYHVGMAVNSNSFQQHTMNQFRPIA